MKFYSKRNKDTLIKEFVSVLKEFGIDTKECGTENPGEYYVTCSARKSGKKRIMINRLKQVNVADANKAHDIAECLRWIGSRALYSGCNISLMPEVLKLINENIEHLPVMSEPEDCAWCPSSKRDDIYVCSSYIIPIPDIITTEYIRKLVRKFVEGTLL